MNKLFHLLVCVQLFNWTAAIGQNLVPNGSFEEYVDCPAGLSDVQAEGWFSSRGTCDYFNSCAMSGSVSVPSNVFGYQNAFTGQAYAGIICFQMGKPEWREHLSISLEQPLQVGETYYVSFYSVLAFNGENNNKACNGQGAYFTTVQHSSVWDDNPNDNPSPLRLDATILNNNVFADTTEWVQLVGSFVADSSYTFLVIGGMLSDMDIDTLDLGINDLTGEAYYYIDEVRVGTDSNYVWHGIDSFTIENAFHEFSVFPNPMMDVLNLGCSEQILSIEIMTMSGQRTKLIERPPNVIDVSTLPSGTYLLKARTSNWTFHKKVIKLNSP